MHGEIDLVLGAIDLDVNLGGRAGRQRLDQRRDRRKRALVTADPPPPGCRVYREPPSRAADGDPVAGDSRRCPLRSSALAVEICLIITGSKPGARTTGVAE